MKKLILVLITILTPGMLFAQTGDHDGAGIAAGVVIFVALFFIFRDLMLWYWKVNKALEKQDALLKEVKATNELLKEQNQLLNKLIAKAGGHPVL